MPKIRSRLRIVGFRRGLGAIIAASAIVFGAGCDERDRLTFETPSDRVGPVTTIDRPNGADTTVSPGPNFFVNGATVDPDGIDTVYILVNGGQNFSPVSPDPVQTTIRFGIPLTTSGHTGETIQIQVYGVDVFGNRGGTSSRLIHIR